MNVQDILNKRAREAQDKVFKQGNNLNAWAVYELEVLGVRCAEGFSKAMNRKTTFFTPEFRIISSQPTISKEAIEKLPLIDRPNEVGGTASMPLPIEVDWAAGKMLDFLSTLTGEAVENFSKEISVEGQPNKTTLASVLTGESQPLKGCRIMCETSEKPLRGKEGSTNRSDYRTRAKFFHSEQTAAATKKILG